MYKITVVDTDTNKEIESVQCDGFELGYVQDKEDGSVYIDGYAYNTDLIIHKHLDIMFAESYENDEF
jgi:DNA-binding beta-propeller fold protein YncE